MDYDIQPEPDTSKDRDWKKARDLMQSEIMRLADENTKLRAALELIRTTGPARHYEIAEKALSAAQ